MFYLGALMYPRDSQKFVNHIKPDNLTAKQANAQITLIHNML